MCRAGIILLAASLCAGGCGLLGGGTPDRDVDAQAKSSESGASATADAPMEDSPQLAAARVLWKGMQCTDARKADTQLTTMLASSEGQPGEHAEVLALRGLARSELGMKEEAFEDLTQAVRQKPVARNYAWRALALWRNGNARGAQVDAQYALRKDKAQPVAHMVLGLAALQAGDTAAACPELRLACEGGECFGLNEAKTAGACLR